MALLLSPCRAVSLAECSVLHSLFSESDNGLHWTTSGGWRSFNGSQPAADCCAWDGVTCDDAARISAVSLPHNNISLPSGLPRRWSLLTFLAAVDLSANHIHGELPAEWQLLVGLTALSVEYNAIGGTIPTAWAAMAALGVLNVGHNHLVGKIPRLSACTFIMCSNLGLNSTLEEIDWAYVADRCDNIWWYLIATSVSGSIPCPPKVKLLELSYTHVSGGVPCCAAMATLGLEGTAVTHWTDCQLNATTSQLQKLFLSHSRLRSVPSDIAARYPVLKYLSLRNLKLTQTLPLLPASIQVVDAAENALTAPVDSLYSMSIRPGFVLMDLTSTAAEGITLDRISFTCSMATAPFPGQDCVLRTTPFAALGRPYNPLAIHEASLLNPMLVLLPSRLLLSHMLYDFVSVLSCVFRPTLTALGAVEGGSIPSHVVLPEPLWNHTFISIPPIPSTISQFDGLVDAPLLFGVVYHLSVGFVYRPIILRQTGETGAAQRDLEVGIVTLPLCSSDLYAVPFTQLCVGCPTHAVCNGSSAFFAKTRFWRPTSAVLPLYACDEPGCDQPEGSPQRRGHECAMGYTGTLCSSCSSGFGKASSGECDPCSSPAWNAFAVIAASIAIFAAASVAAVKSVKADDDTAAADPKAGMLAKILSQKSQMLIATSVKKLQSHMGMYAVVGRLLPAAGRQTESKVLQSVQQAVAQLSLRSVSFASCLFPSLNVVTQFQAMLVLVPALLVVEVLLVRVVRKKWAVFSVVSSICVLLYEMSINLALLLLPTTRLTFYNAAQFTVNRTFATVAEARHVLTLDKELPADDPSNKAWRVAAFVWVGVFGLAVPLVICTFIRHLFAAGRRAEAEERFAFLTSTYRRKRWYWEQVIVLRKFALGVVVVGLQPYPIARAQGLLVVMMVYLIMMEWQSPFATKHMRNAERTTCLGAIIIINTVLGTMSSADTLSEGTGDAAHTLPQAVKLVNSIVQYGALVVLVLFLVAEWRARSAEDTSADADEPVAEDTHAPKQTEAIIAPIISKPFDGFATTLNRSFSLSRVLSQTPRSMRAQDDEESDSSL